MPDRAITKAYKDWLQALENMRQALTANPLVADPLMASAQVFEDIGRMLFGSADKRKKPRAKPKRAAPKAKKPTARAKRKTKR